MFVFKIEKDYFKNMIVFIVVTEEYFGGDIKVFLSRPEAERYIENVDSDEFEMLIIERIIH